MNTTTAPSSVLETPFVEVALPLPLRTLFTYSVPDGLPVMIGSRVLVPFGTRRVTGYVIRGRHEPPDHVRVRAVVDVLDKHPLFTEEILRFFEWIANYYHESLGEVIRAGLPGGLEEEDARMVRVTEKGQAALEAVLSNLTSKERAILSVASSGKKAVPTVLKKAKTTVSAVLEMEKEGLVEVVYERSRSATARARLQKIAVFLGEGDKPPVSKKEAEIVSALQQEEEISITELNRRFKNVSANIKRLEASGAIRVEERRVFRDVWSRMGKEDPLPDSPPPLTDEQQEVVGRLLQSVEEGKGNFLLHGVTGSGKTEVYLRIISRVLEEGKGAIVLVPEIALTPQLVSRFRSRFGEKIAVLHSGLTPGEKLDQWVQIADGTRPIAIGARSAIFAPVPHLGLIVVDEEHETSFKQEERPRYHARDIALVRGTQAGCPVVLGSATPSLESHHNAMEGKFERLEMPSRVLGRPLPAARIVDLCNASMVGTHRVLSQSLAAALRETVARGEQAILFLNRRGYSSFVLCQSCGAIPECEACSITLSYTRKQERLRCHYCGFSRGVPSACLTCGSGPLAPKGFGTERVEQDVRELLGDTVGIVRMDRDTAQGKGLFEVLDAFRTGEAQVLIGTQMVAKGHDFPGVTLVGVLLADQGLKFPDFRASERTFQLITQVAGRAGRGTQPGEVVVQSYNPSHYSLQAACRHHVGGFLEEELPLRRLRGYPPFSFLALIKVTDTDESRAESLSRELHRRLMSVVPAGEDTGEPALQILGPAFAPIQRIKNKTRFQILLKSTDRTILHTVLRYVDAYVDEENLAGTIAVDVDPINLL